VVRYGAVPLAGRPAARAPSPAGCPPVRQALPHPLGRRDGMKSLGIELASDPFQQLAVLLVVGVGDDFEEVRIAPDPAHILGGTGPLAFQAERIPRPGLGGRVALEADLVLPAVAEVIFIL